MALAFLLSISIQRTVVESGVAKMSVVRGCGGARRALARLDDPPDLGVVRGKLSREEIYEDAA
jgi:hypothetical protein